MKNLVVRRLNDDKLIYTVSQEKQDIKLLPITSPNANRFSVFRCQTQQQICNKLTFKYPTTPWACCYTLRCDIDVKTFK